MYNFSLAMHSTFIIESTYKNLFYFLRNLQNHSAKHKICALDWNKEENYTYIKFTQYRLFTLLEIINSTKNLYNPL